MIRICGIPFRFVRLTDPEGEDLANIRHRRQTIEIDFDHCGDETVESCILHEIIEKADEQFALEIGDDKIRVLEATLFEALSGAGIDFSPILDRIAEDAA